MPRAKIDSTPMLCMECGHRFRKTITRRTFEIKCPKCGGYDTDVASPYVAALPQPRQGGAQ